VSQSHLAPDQIFGEVAELYEQARPGYPDELVDDVVRMAGLARDSRILEIGCGTGKATRLFAARGYRMTCLDPSGRMLAVAKRVCATYPGIEFQEITFEAWPPEEQAFDLVISAQSFHWVRPEVACVKAAQALRRGGALAVFWNVPRHDNSDLSRAIDQIYRELVPDLNSPAPGWRPGTGNTPGMIDSSGLFGPVETRVYRWRAEYGAERWIKLLSTHSDHIALAPDRRAALFSAIREAFARSGGVLAVDASARLNFARKA
jgi:ubiquinone/menaquinone biosynthesis C-methylase UbiE